jgi:hypothetical protein
LFPSLFQTTVTSSQQQWLDPSFQLNVPLVDVDKVCLCFQEPLFFFNADNGRILILIGSGFLG